MEAYKLKDKLIQEINNADEGLLRIVEDAIDTYKYTHSSIVSEPVTIGKYNEDISIAESQVAEGDVFTQDEVGEIIKRWGRK